MGRRRSFQSGTGTKFGNRITVVNGRKFHSTAEAHWYEFLLLREAAGEVRNLVCQPRFSLDVNNQHVCSYVSDFSYEELQTDGLWTSRIDDAKGGQLDDVFKNKIKLWRALHGEAYKNFRIVWMSKRKRKHFPGDFYRVVINAVGNGSTNIFDKPAVLLESGGARQVFMVRQRDGNWHLCSSPPSRTGR